MATKLVQNNFLCQTFQSWICDLPQWQVYVQNDLDYNITGQSIVWTNKHNLYAYTCMLNQSLTSYLFLADTYGEGWYRFTRAYLKNWKPRLINCVLDNDKHPVHVVRYEDLQNDRVREVERILDFLHFSYNHDDVVSALEEDYSVFQRSHEHDHIRHYSTEQKEMLRSTLVDLIKLASIREKAYLLHLNEYLESLPDID